MIQDLAQFGELDVVSDPALLHAGLVKPGDCKSKLMVALQVLADLGDDMTFSTTGSGVSGT